MHGLQPLLHDLQVTSCAPSQVWSARDGQIHSHGAQGIYHSDVRVLSRAVVRVDGTAPESVSSGSTGPARFESVALLRSVDGPGPDPTTMLRRRRQVEAGTVRESLELTCATTEPVAATIVLDVGSDLAAMESIKQGLTGPGRAPVVAGSSLRWNADGTGAELTAPGAELTVHDDGATLAWDVTVTPAEPVTLAWTLHSWAPSVVTAPQDGAPEWSRPTVVADDRRLAPWVDRSLNDLGSLRMSTDLTPHDTFLAAGAPWFFTLFGRDSLWAARMMLPLGTDLARGTLRTLAARQGTTVDAASAQQPGKILHEVRSGDLRIDDTTVLPPEYYGTVDATSLWICLLHDAWRWGMASGDVEELLPALEAALAWMRDDGDADGDGFLDYADESGHGLSNQGWKDSGDSIQWRDGTLAEGPIALSEVQAYAYEAAISGARVLDAFGREGADEWRRWAARLQERFRARFWLSDDDGAYVAIALDRHGSAVDTVTSNMGHLLGTGLLDPDEEKTVARRLVAPDMSSGYGLRTLSSRSVGYWPLRYHGGAVWTHDTAIAIVGMARAGLGDEAAVLIRGLLEAAPHMGYQMPELYGGNQLGDGPGPLPYPAACHPQAWSAASAVAILTAVLGLQPGTEEIEVSPITPSPVGALHVTGLRHGATLVDVDIDAEGNISVVAPPTVQADGAHG